ncbi:hypothetical protein ACFQH3_14200 [Haladaptatus sp. GCM10025707]|uniref:DUF7537 family lipoprotein n=1 Tax=unclassified Haladaptatus TaxID=2622732 RepID=UPI0023E81C0C|nr:hypothetical protein [Haladaptatus sp. QDMS2]
MRRIVATVAVFVLLVSAGCSGITGDEPEQEFSATPVDVPTDEPTPTPEPIVPGIGAEGVFDADWVVQSHEAALAGQSVTLHVEENHRLPGERSAHVASSWAFVGADRERFHLVQQIGVAAERNRTLVEYASNGSSTYELSEQANFTIRNVGEGTPPQVQKATYGELLRILFSSVEMDAPQQTWEDGEVLYQVRGRTLADEQAFEEWAGAENVTSVYVNAKITEDGFVRALQLRYVVAHPDGKIVFNKQLTYSDVGGTEVTLPPWWGQDLWLIGENSGGEAALGKRSVAALENKSITVRWSKDVLDNASDYRSRLSSVHLYGTLGANRDRYRTRVYINNSTEQVDFEAFSNGTVRIERRVTRDTENVTVASDEAGNPIDPAAARRVRQLSVAEAETLLSAIEFEDVIVDTNAEPGEGPGPRYIFVGRAVGDEQAMREWTGYDNVSNVSASVSIAASGAIRGYRLEYTIHRNGQSDGVSETYYVHGVDEVQVDAPYWANQTTEPDSAA